LSRNDPSGERGGQTTARAGRTDSRGRRGPLGDPARGRAAHCWGAGVPPNKGGTADAEHAIPVGNRPPAGRNRSATADRNNRVNPAAQSANAVATHWQVLQGKNPNSDPMARSATFRMEKSTGAVLKRALSTGFRRQPLPGGHAVLVPVWDPKTGGHGSVSISGEMAFTITDGHSAKPDP